MCFRPAGAGFAVQCPECGTFNKPTATACQKCGYTVEAPEAQAAPAIKAPGNAPVAPRNASAAPGNAPTAPDAPGNAPRASKGPEASEAE